MTRNKRISVFSALAAVTVLSCLSVIVIRFNSHNIAETEPVPHDTEPALQKLNEEINTDFKNADTVDSCKIAETETQTQTVTYNHDSVLRKFNEEHGTNYKIADDQQLSVIGVDPKEKDTFFAGMTDSEFEAYLESLYKDDELTKKEYEINNIPFTDYEETPDKTTKAKLNGKFGIEFCDE